MKLSNNLGWFLIQPRQSMFSVLLLPVYLVWLRSYQMKEMWFGSLELITYGISIVVTNILQSVYEYELFNF